MVKSDKASSFVPTHRCQFGWMDMEKYKVYLFTQLQTKLSSISQSKTIILMVLPSILRDNILLNTFS